MEATCIPTTQHPTESLFQQVRQLGDGYLQISSPEIEWFVYGRAGQVLCLSNSIEPFERLTRVLRRCLQGTAIDAQAISLHARAQYEQASEAASHSTSAAPPELDAHYQVLCWLQESGQLSDEWLAQVMHQISLEVLESFWQLPEGSCSGQAIATPCALTALPSLDFPALCTEVQARLQRWQTFQPEIYSPYQRPYLSGLPFQQGTLSPEFQARLRQVLIGFSLRQVSMLMGQDDLVLAQQLLPLVQQGIIKLHAPFTPFDRLPWKRPETQSSPPVLPGGLPVTPRTNLAEQVAPIAAGISARPPANLGDKLGGSPDRSVAVATAKPAKVWNIVCIDDSPAVLNEINRFLQTDLFSVTLIDDSKKALMRINSIKPDIILLDANMPGVDGYQVCTMLRKSASLRHIPVIMVTGNRGLVNRAKAKMAGITDYLNKPFSQKDLLEMVFRHLSE